MREAASGEELELAAPFGKLTAVDRRGENLDEDLPGAGSSWVSRSHSRTHGRLSHLLRSVAETEISVPGLVGLLSRSGVTVAAYDALWSEARSVIDRLVGRLHQRGARGDLSHSDLWVLLEAVRSTTNGRQMAGRDSARLITLIVDGLRAP